MELNILTGGPVEFLPPDILKKAKADTWIGVDHGAVYLAKHGIRPLFSIGDFDSATPKEQALVRKFSHKLITAIPEKDQTDTELALLECELTYSPERINVYGATGGRLDHFLANLLSVLNIDFPKLVEKVCFIDRQNLITFYLPGEHELRKAPEMKYLAFIPLTAVTGLTLSDEKYRLTDQKTAGPLAYISNEFLGSTAHFKFTSGVVCVIQSRD